mgnify:CR=1 FL=1
MIVTRTLVADTQGNILGAIERVPSSQGDDRWKEARFDVTELAGKDVRLLVTKDTTPRSGIPHSRRGARGRGV